MNASPSKDFLKRLTFAVVFMVSGYLSMMKCVSTSKVVMNWVKSSPAVKQQTPLNKTVTKVVHDLPRQPYKDEIV